MIPESKIETLNLNTSCEKHFVHLDGSSNDSGKPKFASDPTSLRIHKIYPELELRQRQIALTSDS